MAIDELSVSNTHVADLSKRKSAKRTHGRRSNSELHIHATCFDSPSRGELRNFGE